MKKVVIIFVIMAFGIKTVFCAGNIKEPDLAGSWYPASKAGLENMLKEYMDAANPDKVDGKIFAIISPHAGYQFSGPVAAYGFKAAQKQNVKTVIVIGFAHRKHFGGISLYGPEGIFRTPLGDLPIDAELAKTILSQNKRILFEPSLFDEENSVEIQLPFIQMAFRDVRIVPIAFGTQDFEDALILAEALRVALKDRDDCLVIASTDMSHYHPYDEANSIDKRAISLIEDMKARDLYDECMMRTTELCGIMPVAAVLMAAEKLGFNSVKVLKYANSGDTFGDKSRVVGYLSAAVYKKAYSVQRTAYSVKEENGEGRMLNDTQRKRLLQIARESITSYVRDGKRKSFEESDAVLNEPMGAFVTLHESGELRGCIGNMIAQGPLYKTVADMAIEAATGDPRFSQLSPQELDKIDIEISVLSPLRKVASHEDVKIPGHGVLVRKGLQSGVYLPQVAAETGWSKEEFLTSLCGHKAGMSPNAWKDPATEIYVFTAEVFGEKDVRDEGPASPKLQRGERETRDEGRK